MKNKKGITLISLVITIVIIIILSSIVIYLSLGENGIFKRAKYAKNKYINAQKTEEEQLEELYGQLLIASDGTVNISVDKLKELIKNEVKTELKNVSVTPNPVGSIQAQMGNEVPSGYLKCDGTEYKIEDYPQLSDYIKEQFGKYDYWGGNGTTTFAVPNLNDNFLKGSNIAGNFEEAGLPNITGQIRHYTYETGEPSGAFKSNILTARCITAGTSTNYNFNCTNFDASASNSIYGKSTTVTPKNISVLYCIKY